MIRAGFIIRICSSVTPHVGADMKGWIKFTGFTMLVTVLLVSCAPRPLPQSTEAQWTPTNSKWKVRKSSSAATGHAKCTALRDPLAVFLLNSPEFGISGALTVFTVDDLYPGRAVYLAVGGERFKGEEHILLSPQIVHLLREYTVAYISWSPSPSGGTEEATVELEGFDEAYQQCVSYVGGEPKDW